MKRIQDWQIMLFIFLVGLPFSGTLAGGDMQNAVVDLSAAIVEDGSLTIDSFRTNSPDIAFYNGHYYSGMPPGLSFLAVPVYWTSGQALDLLPAGAHAALDKGIAFKKKRLLSTESVLQTPFYKEQILTHSLLTLFFAAGLGALSYLLVNRIGRIFLEDLLYCRYAGLAYAFATVMVNYHTAYYTQSVALFFLLLAFWCLFAAPDKPAFIFAGAVAAGYAGTIDYPFLLYGIITAAGAVVFTRRSVPIHIKTLLCICGFVLGVAPALLYHMHAFGHPLATPYAFRTVVRLHDTGFLGLTWPSLVRLRELLFSLDEGLLFLCPVCLLFPLGIRRAFSKNSPIMESEAKGAVLTMLLIICAAGLFFISVPWESNKASFGPRFFLAAIPFMTLLAVPVDNVVWKRAFFLLALYGAVVNQLFLIGIQPSGLFSLMLPGESADLGRFFLLHPFIRIPWPTGLAIYFIWTGSIAALLLVPSYLRKENVRT